MISNSSETLVSKPKTGSSLFCRCISFIGYVLLGTIILPIYGFLILFFLIGWGIFTVTGLGPLIHYCYRRRDETLLKRENILALDSQLKLITIPGNINAASKGESYQVMARWTIPNTPNDSPPIIFPNGLAATQIFLARPQDMLCDLGYSCLTFDRLGCGFSDPNTAAIAPSAADICREMDYVINSVGISQDTKWIGVGGSMGNTVLQAYLSLFPNKIVGLLNLDGFPYPYLTASKDFAETFAGQYAFMASIIWTGIFRLFNGMATGTWEKNAKSKHFSVNLIMAQMNSRNFFANTVLEFKTMMSCCELANAAWGNHSVLKFDEALLETMVNAAPTESVIVDRREGIPRTITNERSAVENGDTWADPAQVEAATRAIRGIPLGEEIDLDKVSVSSDLGHFAVGGRAGGVVAGENVYSLVPQWREMVVRCMSCRAYGFPAESFIKKRLVDFSAAEHTVLALLAKDGKRIVYPKLTHSDGFAQSEEIVAQVEEIARLVKELQA